MNARIDKKLEVRTATPAEMADFNPSYIKCKECGDITEFVLLARSPAPIPVKRLSKDFFQIIGDDTGEVFEYQHATDKSGSITSVKRTLAKLRSIINTNCVNASFLHWVTMTYAENMRDRARLHSDFKKFWQKFKRWLVKHGYSIPEYIAVVEPQGRGAWHLHIILIWDKKAPFIDNNSIFAPMWGHGWTKIQAVHGVDNLGAYFSAYLADIPLDEFEREKNDTSTYAVKYNEVSDDDSGKKTRKAFVKGARLRLYPSEMNIYRCSRGVKMPVVSTIDLNEYEKKKASSGKLTFSNTVAILSDDGEQRNIITHEYYNIKRK